MFSNFPGSRVGRGAKVIANIATKAAIAVSGHTVQAVATANVSISAPGTTLDGYTLALGDRVLLTAQTTGSQNGIWVFNGPYALTRPIDFATGSVQRKGLLVSTGSGSTYPSAIWMLATDNITVDTTASTWAQFSPSGGGSGALTKITSVTTSGSQASVTLSSIPGTYTGLELKIIGRATSSTSGTTLRLQFNGDTGNNYAYELAVDNNSTRSYDTSTNNSSLRIGDLVDASFAAGFASTFFTEIFGYAQTTFVKPVWSNCSVHKGTGTNSNDEVLGGGWSSTSAITSIKLFPASGNWFDGSIVALYGVS